MTKEALKLALEALQNPWKAGPDGVADAITAIKKALAQDALDKKAENARELGLDYYVPCCTDKTCSKCKAALEAKDEPVVFNTLASLKHKKTVGPIERAMLNATPPQRTWVGLTDEEINGIAKNYSLNNPTTPLHFAQAIETKLKEKNK
jgi:hypothetical protein